MADIPANPYHPGPGHSPAWLAGRSVEIAVFRQLLGQTAILENLVLTGLRGAGKTVLLDRLKHLALQQHWCWVGTDLSDVPSISEERLVLRLLTDISVLTASLEIGERDRPRTGFGSSWVRDEVRLDFRTLRSLYDSTPGLPSDKLKRVLEIAWSVLKPISERGLIFACDGAQNLTDPAAKDHSPLSLLLDVFRSIQEKEIPFMLALAGLPPLVPRLAEARAFAEAMFRVVYLDNLSPAESREAILKPLGAARPPVHFDEQSIRLIIEISGGCPSFIQFLCREFHDALLQGQTTLPVAEITRKLDTLFFAGHWARASERQRALMSVIAQLDGSAAEFTVREIAAKSRELLDKPFSASHINQLLSALSWTGLVCKNRHGRYSFAVPLMVHSIRRRIADDLRSAPGGTVP